MKDLVLEFFNRNFTEGDWTELEHILRDSPEEAARLASLAEQSYLRTGLPLPQWPADVPLRPVKKSGVFGSGGTWIGLAAAALLGVALLAWKLSAPSSQVEVKTTLEPVVPPALSKTAAPPLVLHRLPPPPMAVPRKAAEGAEAGQLSVLVELEEAQPVTVEVLDPSNRLRRVLFTGRLGAGDWSIRWDGLLSNGLPAASGDYRIQVQAGPNLLSKDVEIESKGP